ncbi:hypothetical protein Plim_2632 [Planctopirus limnophila DSM 3776]|uniref:Lipoprotein n=1 Tax=Planctopirus limnophila (strain ATCC 43296 / DSM 3776 / IFAM 1008 / Mu 290) TaxID=521674 RepID=D5SQJ4_PLAL2|nr:hypothetical protein [Planctopirus limnophila]ADG68456.1 hypothetical protein Plim_2632 [Planctopirus limnophila DSM 3776]
MKQVVLSLGCAIAVALVSGCDSKPAAKTTTPPVAAPGHSGVGGEMAPTSEKPAAAEMPADPKPAETKAEEPKAEAPKVEEAKPAEPKAEEPKAEEPKKEVENP